MDPLDMAQGREVRKDGVRTLAVVSPTNREV